MAKQFSKLLLRKLEERKILKKIWFVLIQGVLWMLVTALVLMIIFVPDKQIDTRLQSKLLWPMMLSFILALFAIGVEIAENPEKEKRLREKIDRILKWMG